MIELKDIKKDYVIGNEKIHALKGINLKFRNSEFVSILGQSGCGKTTLLNIIGGLDKYSSGDLIVNGESTKDFKDSDWDYYRNYSVGFVFQSYNLIQHQTVLANVEMALTISGYSKDEKRKKAIKALEDVGLGKQINKKPNQLSGGQMQRVAIARAIVNDPDIILADEPTGALDTQTSIQIMDLLKNISKDKLIVMVTHNPELAKKYSSRIVKLLDGEVIDDSNPYIEEDLKEEIKQENKNKKNTYKNKKTQMKFITAFKLSFNNLLTKKGRTFLTAFAGSVGIIGIALILSISTGMQDYINKVEEDTLSSYPITIEEESVDMSTLMEGMMEEQSKDVEYSDNLIHSRNIMTDVMSKVSAEVKTNNLKEFKDYIENKNDSIKNASNAIQYEYDLNLNLYTSKENGKYYQTNPCTVLDSFGKMGENISASSSTGLSMMSTDIWTELINNEDLLKTQYNVIAGKWPEKFNEVVLILDKDNQISDYTLYALGMKDSDELSDMFKKILNGEKIEKSNQETYNYDDFLNLKLKLLLNSDYYKKENGIWVDKSKNEEYINELLNNALDINIVGIIKPNEESNVATNAYGILGYSSELTKYVINKVNDSDIVKEQKEKKDINVFTGKSFTDNSSFSYDMLTTEQKMQLSMLSEEEKISYISSLAQNTSSTYEDNLKAVGSVDLESPKAINIYPINFDSKETIKNYIEEYNTIQKNDGNEDNVIEYSDLVGTLMSSVTNIVNIISYVLIAFVSISLVVSSIMIAIITYISVLERTKEIGILRAMGTSKKDISKIFNAETFIEGLCAGILGIVITLIINIPINMILKKVIGVSTIATLPFKGAIILIIISVFLNVVAGLIPANLAAKKDPAEVLRSE